MFRYRFLAAYRGTEYHGWQHQSEASSVAATLIHCFKQTFNHDATVQGASRTDAGVHALGQVCMLSTLFYLCPRRMEKAWNAALPGSIAVRALELVPEHENIFANVAYKLYHYHIFLERPLPFVSDYGWFVGSRFFDLKLLSQALAVFVGTHDFRAFCSSEETRSNTIRTIDALNIEFIQEWNAYRIVCKGHSFLRHMIRRIIGSCVTVAQHKRLTVDDLRNELYSKQSRACTKNAPAHGLLLYKIVYHKDNKG